MMGSKCRVWVWVKLLLLMLFVLVENCWSERCWEEERLALLQLKHVFNDPYSLQNWVENSSDCCGWERVKCSNTTSTRRVIELNLRLTRNLKSGVEWYLNASLFSPFQELERLDLTVNTIAGFVDNQGLKKLSKLKILNLGDNLFNNSILSSLRGLSSLRQLDLSNNMLGGTIHIKGLSKLEYLDLSGNSLNRSFLSSLTGLSLLRTLHISGIGLLGAFHVHELDSLSNLEELDLSYNDIDKFVVPKDYKGLRKLNTIYINTVGVGISDGSNLFHSMGSFPSLKKLELRNNNFKATVPIILIDFKIFTNLEDLTLDGTSLRISLLQNIAAFNSLKRLSMRNCQLHGISKFQGFLTFKNLEYLNMGGSTPSNNSFFQISRLMTSSLKVLDLSSCELKGTLSDQGLCELVHLRELYIFNNDLVGTFPWCLEKMISLRVFDVSSNQLIGNIPWYLANMTSLEALDVSSNQLTGNISSSSPLVHLSSIRDLKLSNNQFQIPISLGPFYNHSNLTSFYGENNNQVFAETESHSMAPKFQLIYLILPGNGDGRMFPKFLYHQYDLKQVDLSHNNLTENFQIGC